MHWARWPVWQGWPPVIGWKWKGRVRTVVPSRPDKGKPGPLDRVDWRKLADRIVKPWRR